MVVLHSQIKESQERKSRRYKIEIIRENGVIEFMKIGFGEIRTLYNAHKDAGNKITIREGLINLVLERAMEIAELQASESPVKRITLIPDV